MSLILIIAILSIFTNQLSIDKDLLMGSWYLKQIDHRHLLFVRQPSYFNPNTQDTFQIELFFERERLLYKSVRIGSITTETNIVSKFYTWAINPTQKELNSEVKEQFQINQLFIEKLTPDTLVFALK